MDIYNDDGKFIDLNIEVTGGIAGLAGLTYEEAAAAFGADNVNAAIIAASSVRISKLTLVDRLHDAGLFALAMAAIKSDDYQYERWQASQSVDSTNKSVRDLLTAVGGDLDILLARE